MRPVRVSQLNSYIKRVLSDDPILSDIRVIGEISNIKYHSILRQFVRTVSDILSRATSASEQETTRDIEQER